MMYQQTDDAHRKGPDDEENVHQPVGAQLARNVKGVKSGRNDLQVK